MTPSKPDRHISHQFDKDLDHIRTHMLAMGGLVELQVRSAVNAIENTDFTLAQEVLTKEKEIDAWELKIDEACIQILVKRQPAASDLRMVLTVARCIRDLERIGDEAKKIASMAIALCESEAAPFGYGEIRSISNLVEQMLHDILDAFARFDALEALAVAEQDQQVNREYKQAIAELIVFMSNHPKAIDRLMNIMWTLRSLERIGDHAKNMGEHVIYLVKGIDVRHSNLQKISQSIRNSS